jgi:hypothetical protein
MRPTYQGLDQRGGDRRPETRITAQPVGMASDAQGVLIDLRRRFPLFEPGAVTAIKATGLISRCLFLAAEGGGPFCFRFIGAASGACLLFGTAWARRALGKPHADVDSCPTFASAIDWEYAAAAGAAEIRLNHVFAAGAAPRVLNYRQLVIPWLSPTGDRAILVATEQ